MKRCGLTVALLFVTLAVNAQIYQWKDANGKTVMSDKPPIGNAQPQRKFESASTGEAPSPQKSVADRELEFRKRQKEARESTEKANKEQAASADKKEYCDNARRQLQALESGERIALRDDKGERYFMEDAQREQEIAKTRQGIQSNCK